jgi:hypothetical protein
MKFVSLSTTDTVTSQNIDLSSWITLYRWDRMVIIRMRTTLMLLLNTIPTSYTSFSHFVLLFCSKWHDVFGMWCSIETPPPPGQRLIMAYQWQLALKFHNLTKWVLSVVEKLNFTTVPHLCYVSTLLNIIISENIICSETGAYMWLRDVPIWVLPAFNLLLLKNGTSMNKKLSSF